MGSTTTDYIYDQAGHAIDEVNSAGNAYAAEIYAGSLHIVDGCCGTLYYIHSDWLGTERVMTLPNGSVQASCTNLAFGDNLTCSGGWNSWLHFTGDFYDSETNLSYTPFRQHSSTQGRWPTPDPAGLAAVDASNPQTWNRYAYVGNTPLNAVDPMGLNIDDNPHWDRLDAIGSGTTCFSDPNCATDYVNGVQVSPTYFNALLDTGNGAGGGKFWAVSDENGHWAYAGFDITSNGDLSGMPVADWVADLPNLGLLAQNNLPGAQNLVRVTRPRVPRPRDPILAYDKCATRARNQAERNQLTVDILASATLGTAVAGCAGTGPFIMECEAGLALIDGLVWGVNSGAAKMDVWDSETKCMQVW